MYRDRFTQWAQSAFDATVPETAESIARARAYQRQERAALLEELWNAGAEQSFDAKFVEFYREDPAILNALTTRTASTALCRAYKLDRVQ